MDVNKLRVHGDGIAFGAAWNPGKVTYHLDVESAFGHNRFPGAFVYVDKDGQIKMARIKQVMYSNPATIVFWDDGTKTTVKCYKDDVYNPETGLVMCVLKKVYGTTKVKDFIDAWIPKNVEYKTRVKPVIRSLRDLRAAEK